MHVDNLTIGWVESSGYWLRQCVLRLVGDCDRAFRWTSFSFHEVALIPAALKHFLEDGFSDFCVKGVLQQLCKRQIP